MAFPTKAEQEQKARDAEYEVARENGLVEIYRAFPIIPRNAANDGMIDLICATFLEVPEGEKVAPTLAVFRDAVEADPSLLGGGGSGGGSGVSIEAVARQKLRIIEDIENLLSDIMTPFDLRTESKKLSFQSLEQVQARKAQIIERQRLSKLPTSEIRQAIEASRPKDTRRYQGYPNLPEIIVPPGQVQAVRCDSTYLLNLARTDFWEYKRLCNRFSSQQITDRQKGIR